MSTIVECECGFDSADFVSQHQIGDGARFECPLCGGNVEMKSEATGIAPITSSNSASAAS
jgi:hypothetical protein